MAPVQLWYYQDERGKVPVAEWLEQLKRSDRPANRQCERRLEELRLLGHELRRPKSDYLEAGIYELRARSGTVQFRILYAFLGREVVVLCHALTKEKSIPPGALQLARRRLADAKRDPKSHLTPMQ